jgi:peptidoglycan hydrolase-like protein with peptidoglycan-binding domain
MSPSRSPRPARDWDDADREPAPSGGLPLRLVGIALRNPITTGGVVLSLLMIGSVVGNAFVNQPAPHPHPFYATRGNEPARPAGSSISVQQPAAGVGAQPTGPSPSPVPAVLPRPKPAAALDPDAVQDLQLALRDRGYYNGPLDGVVGPATADAIRAFERRLGATPTGEPSDLLIAAVRATPPLPTTTGSIPTAAASAPVPPSAQPGGVPVRATAVEPRTPAPRTPAVDAVAWPAGSDPSVVEIDAPVPVATIKRAQREPLARGGDERLQKIQRALIAAGYGPLKADGRWDDRSIAAVKRYETDRGWPASGKPTDRLVYDLMAGAPQTHR